MIQKWKYDEVGQDIQRDTSRDPNEISAPLEHLQELKNSDYKIDDLFSRIYGWPVVDAVGARMGILKDFLYDKTDKRIRYLVVSLEKGARLKEEKDILIPIGRAELNQKEQKVFVQEQVSFENLKSLPTYRSVKSLAIEDEKKTLLIFSSKQKEELDYTQENFYNQEDFNERTFFGSDEE
jgi:sporulation protein YlmC with PRC-barrel domain